MTLPPFGHMEPTRKGPVAQEASREIPALMDDYLVTLLHRYEPAHGLINSLLAIRNRQSTHCHRLAAG